MKLSSATQSLINLFEQTEGPVFVHSDLFVASAFVPRHPNPEQLLQDHINFLKTNLGKKDLWFPVFNYQFPKTRKWNLQTAPSEVGILNEYFRFHEASWQSIDPIFSVCGKGEAPEGTTQVNATIHAFDSNSCLAKLVEHEGSLLFYGAPFSAVTMIHHAEFLVGGPLYRYDKTFAGKIVVEAEEYPVEYIYHVRPILPEPYADYDWYDWQRLESDLVKEGLLNEVKGKKRVYARVISARKLIDYWVGQLKDDPFYLLKDVCKKWIVPKINQLGRRFQLQDFE